MIGYLDGVVHSKSPPQIVLLCSGVGYELDVPMSTFADLPETGCQVALWTHLSVREDGHFLYGFLRERERAAFRLLLKVSGIGARTALAVLSGLSVDELARAISLQESGRLIKIPGIGKKTAERLLLELKDKSPAISTQFAAAPPPRHADTLQALLALGYNEREAHAAMQNLPDSLSVADAIRQALRHLAKS